MGVYLPAARLPSTYQEVERIQSSGTQYLNTSKYVETGHKYVAKFQFKSANAWSTFGGHYGNSSSNRLFAGMAIVNGAVWGYGFGSSTAYTYGSAATDTDYEVETLLKSGSQYFKLNGSTLFTNTFTYSSSTSHNIKVFASVEPNNSAGIWTSTRMYYRKLYDTSDQLELDLVPCYRKSDSVIGMYDLVNGTFYTNAGSGTFTKGADVTSLPLKNAYIGYGWSPGSNTIAYYPLTTNGNDRSGKGRNLTTSGITFTTKGSVNCALVSGFGYNSSWSATLNQITLNGWFNMNTKTDHYCLVMGLKSGANTSNTNNTFILGDFDGRPANGFGLQYSASSGGDQSGVGSGTPGSRGVWYNGCITWDGSTIKVYLNGVLKTTQSWSTKLARDAIILGWSANNSNVYVSNAIYESEAWTANDVLNYFNSTKSTYGIS